jgi:hypothetical protein
MHILLDNSFDFDIKEVININKISYSISCNTYSNKTFEEILVISSKKKEIIHNPFEILNIFNISDDVLKEENLETIKNRISYQISYELNMLFPNYMFKIIDRIGNIKIYIKKV